MTNSNARDTAYEIIKEKIIRLQLKPGEVLSDKQTAEELEISRTPVREAMIMLSMADLLVVRPQSSTYVAPIDLEIVEMEQFTRCALEKEMIRRACANITSQTKSLYEENNHLYEFYEKSNIEDRSDKLLKLDNDFHCISFLLNGKKNYFDRMKSNMYHADRLRILSLSKIRDDRILADHQKIAEAIQHNQLEQATSCLETHMNLYLEHIDELKRELPEFFRV